MVAIDRQRKSCDGERIAMCPTLCPGKPRFRSSGFALTPGLYTGSGGWIDASVERRDGCRRRDKVRTLALGRSIRVRSPTFSRLSTTRIRCAGARSRITTCGIATITLAKQDVDRKRDGVYALPNR